MKIHEFQAKKIFSDYGIAVPRGEVARTPDEVKTAAEKLDGPVVVKAQIHAGGRGKGGGVKLAKTPEEACDIAKMLLGTQLVTPQTRPGGQKVKQVLVEQGLAIERELYLGIVIDRTLGAPVIMASAAGGMEIEEVAAATPEKIVKAVVDPATGLWAMHARKLLYGLNLEKELMKPAAALITALYNVFMDKDCSLIEINPLVVTADQRLLALDAKMNFDDDALYRHPDIKELLDPDEQEPLEREAAEHGLNYIKLDGNVGCMVNGAGLAMATMDLIKIAGGEPANFLDVGGGASAGQVEKAFRILVADPGVRVVLVNIFGGILRCDRVATGMLEAAKNTGLTLPLVVRLEGTNVEEGRRILQESGLNFEVAGTFDDAARKVSRWAAAGAPEDK